MTFICWLESGDSWQSRPWQLNMTQSAKAITI
jgi:hypothetical protein